MDGLKLDCKNDCNPLPGLGIKDNFWLNIIGQISLSLIFYTFGYIFMIIRSRKKYMKGKEINKSKKSKKKGKLKDYSKSLDIGHKESELSVMLIQEIR